MPSRTCPTSRQRGCCGESAEPCRVRPSRSPVCRRSSWHCWPRTSGRSPTRCCAPIRSRSSAWAAVCRAGSPTRRHSGACCVTASTPCAKSPRIAGTRKPRSTPIPLRRARPRRNRAAFSTRSTASTRPSSASCRARPSGWTRSSGSSSRSRSRRSITPGCRASGSPDRAPACSSRAITTTTRSSSTTIPRRSTRAR